MISVITPTYNRFRVITRSIESSLIVISKIGGELIIVDDCSSDDTLIYLKAKYYDLIEAGLIKVFSLGENIGVTGAKNFGAKHAKFEWVVFMDSDDSFLPDVANNFFSELKRLDNFDLIFFRCIDMYTKELIGADEEGFELKFEELLNNGTPGECLPVVRRDAIYQFPYPTELRCCESLAYKEMLSHGKRAYVSNLVVREYDASGDDRLSTFRSRMKRAHKLQFYFKNDLKYLNFMTIKIRIYTIFRYFFYRVLNFVYNGFK